MDKDFEGDIITALLFLALAVAAASILGGCFVGLVVVAAP